MSVVAKESVAGTWTGGLRAFKQERWQKKVLGAWRYERTGRQKKEVLGATNKSSFGFLRFRLGFPAMSVGFPWMFLSFSSTFP